MAEIEGKMASSLQERGLSICHLSIICPLRFNSLKYIEVHSTYYLSDGKLIFTFTSSSRLLQVQGKVHNGNKPPIPVVKVLLLLPILAESQASLLRAARDRGGVNHCQGSCGRGPGAEPPVGYFNIQKVQFWQ